jgi:hypothetical protein
LPDIRPVGYPTNPKAGYRILGRIPVSGKGRIPDIRPDTWLDNYIFGQISNTINKTALTITPIDFLQMLNKPWSSNKTNFCANFFLAFFEGKLNKFLDYLIISRISGLISSLISGRAIWYPAGYQISKKAGSSGRISGQPDIRCIPNLLPLAKRLTGTKKTMDGNTKDATYFIRIFFVSCD